MDGNSKNSLIVVSSTFRPIDLKSPVFILILMLLVANLANTKWGKNAKNTETIWCSSESSQWELSNEYQHDRIQKSLRHSA